jgi:hypothetical protein
MANVFIYRFDGSRQCDPERRSRSVDDDRKALATLIGDAEIRHGEKLRVPVLVTERCGSPTGMGNVFEITEAGAYKLFHGFPGPQDFRLWTWEPPFPSAKMLADDNPVPWPWKNIEAGALANTLAALTQVGTQPTMLVEIVGRRVRVFKDGDAVTMDWMPSRVNIVTNDYSDITRIYFG